VLQDRGETGSRFGRATFSVLLLQDLAVVLVFMLVPLLAPTPDGSIHTLAILKVFPLDLTNLQKISTATFL
jgi:Kef-type K+ transport system membrane component KefB